MILLLQVDMTNVSNGNAWRYSKIIHEKGGQTMTCSCFDKISSAHVNMMSLNNGKHKYNS